MKPNKEQRQKLYKQALKEIKNDSGQCICYAVNRNGQSNFDCCIMTRSSYPELDSFFDRGKPYFSQNKGGEFWSSMYFDERKKFREIVLLLCIEMTK